MKLSVFSSTVFYLVKNGVYKDAYEAYKSLHAMGVGGSEVFDWAPSQEYSEILSALGMAVSSLNTTVRSERDTKRVIEEAAKIGAPCVMLIPQKPFTHSELAEYVRFAAEASVRVTIENAGAVGMAETVAYLDAVPGLGYTYDNGNFTLLGEDMLTAYQKLQKYTINAHIKDWRFSETGQYALPDGRKIDGAPLGQGFLPIAEWVRAAHTYDGYVTVEINTNVPLTNQVWQSIAFLKDRMEGNNVSK